MAAIHPGEFVKTFITESDLTITEAAKRLGVDRNTLSELVNGRRGVSPEMAVRLEKATPVSAKEWMQRQTEWELDQIRPDAEKLEVVPFGPSREEDSTNGNLSLQSK